MPLTGDMWAALFFAIAQIESGGVPAVNESEQAHGIYQIRQVYLDDANEYMCRRSCKWMSYTLQDVHASKSKSENMIRAYSYRYKSRTPEEIARRHNGGPRGMEKSSTIKYWKKVKPLYEAELMRRTTLNDQHRIGR